MPLMRDPLKDHVERELAYAGMVEAGVYSADTADAFETFKRLLQFLPLRPLTGQEHEWEPHLDGVQRNRRCPTVFQKDGVAWHSDAIIYVDAFGDQFSHRGSKPGIIFPYWPEITVEVRPGYPAFAKVGDKVRNFDFYPVGETLR